jgi:phage shock protein PspC (stress-responsive transcriptional regulator)
MQRNKLYRSSSDNILGGVCGGIANHLDVDSTIIRLIVVAAALFGGTGVVFYIIAWLIIPMEPDGEKTSIPHINGIDAIDGETAEGETQKDSTSNKEKPSSNKVLGGIFILVGAFLFINIWFPYISWEKFLPFIFVLLGLYLLLRSQK